MVGNIIALEQLCSGDWPSKSAWPGQWCWLRALFSGRRQLLCFPVWVAFAMSVSLLYFWPLILQGNLCPPSTFNLFLVFLLSFWCYMKGFLKCLLALGVESLNKSKAYPNSFPALVTFWFVWGWEEGWVIFFRGEVWVFNWYCQFLVHIKLCV